MNLAIVKLKARAYLSVFWNGDCATSFAEVLHILLTYLRESETLLSISSDLLYTCKASAFYHRL